jgi:hypothetical protein
MNANPLTTVSLMLTLAGLVGTFFNIQLSQWLRDLLALDQKAETNSAQGTEQQQRAIVECEVELRRLANRQTYIVNTAVALFVVFVITDGLVMATWAQSDPLFGHVSVALWVFLALFVVGTIWLMYSGWRTSKSVKSNLSPPTKAVTARRADS